jgi:hypothetical protein
MSPRPSSANQPLRRRSHSPSAPNN